MASILARFSSMVSPDAVTGDFFLVCDLFLLLFIVERTSPLDTFSTSARLS